MPHTMPFFPECLYNVVSAFSVKLVQLVLDLCVYMFVCMHAWFVCVCVCVPNTGHLNNVAKQPNQKQMYPTCHVSPFVSPFNCCLCCFVILKQKWAYPENLHVVL